MKYVIPGGSGQVGTVLARELTASGDEVVVLSRAPASPTERAPWRNVAWDGVSLGPWRDELEGADVLVNLAGRSVNCRYGDANRRAIMDSRVLSTRVLGRALAEADAPPRVWLQASTATIYAHRFDAPNDEASGVLGGAEPDAPDTWMFSIDVAKSWEREALAARTERTRQVLMRSAMTMSPDRGGVFDVLLGLVRRGLGGAPAGGRQYVSWIHDADFVRAVRFLALREDLEGPVNLAAPNPLPYREFTAALREAWGISFGLPTTRWMLEIGCFLMRTESELVLKSRRVVPGRLRAAGFRFEFERWPEAARDLVERWRRARLGR